MYLFTRSTRVTGDLTAMATAVEITEFVTNNSGLNVSLWAQALGPEPGTIVWSALVESQSELVEANDKLMSHDEYAQLVAALRPHIAPLVDAIRTEIHSTGQLDPANNFVSVMMGQVATDLPGAMAWSVEMCDFASQIGGTPVSLGANTIGPIGQLTWMSTAPDVATIEAIQTRLWMDEGYIARIGQANFFSPGVGGQAIFRRVSR